MIGTDDNASPWRALWLIPVSVVAVLTIVATGGDDGGGGSIDDVDSGTVNLLPSYSFFLTNVSDAGTPLLTTSLANSTLVSFDIDGLLANTLDISVDSNNEVTFLSYVARRSSQFDLIVMSMPIVRHPVPPGNIGGTDSILEFLAEDISADTYLNIMDQYRPCYRADANPPLDRRTTTREYARAIALADAAGLRRVA